MKIKLLFVASISVIGLAACGSPQALNNSAPKAGTAITSSPSPAATPTPVPTSITPKDGDYPGKGVVTKINLELGSVELDHEEIKGVMPPMRMEFYVSDKKMLDGLKVGDKIDFTLRYKDYTETIVGITKSK